MRDQIVNNNRIATIIINVKMATSETVMANLEAGMKMISLTSKNIDKILIINKLREIEKSLKTLEHQKDEVEGLKIAAQTLMFNENKDDDVVFQYGEEVDIKIRSF